MAIIVVKIKKKADKLSSNDDFKHAIFGSTLISDVDSSIKARIHMKSAAYRHLFKSNVRRVGKLQNDLCEFKCEKFDWSYVHVGKLETKEILTDNLLRKYKSEINFIREYEISCSQKRDDILITLLERYLGDDLIIPYSIDERRYKYPLAFKELDRYMKKYSS